LIYVTGDTHGDITRFKGHAFNKIKKRDTLIICGDFGFIWNGSKKEQSILKKIGKLKYTVAFVDGCHENFDLLEGYEPSEWNGGKIRRISGNLIQLMRGQVYNIDNKTIFTFGGGHSQDFDLRLDAQTWWEREQPTPYEISEGANNLQRYNNQVDYIITHEPPYSFNNCLNIETQQRLEVHYFFEDVMKNCKYKGWYFGKCHINKFIPQKFYASFDELYKLDK
jgi:hypothetical protein